MVEHGKVTETYVAETLQNKIYCDKFISLKLLLTKLFKIKCFLGNLCDAQYRNT